MEIITQENQGSELALKATDLLNGWRDYPANRSRSTQISLAVSISLLDLAPRSRFSIYSPSIQISRRIRLLVLCNFITEIPGFNDRTLLVICFSTHAEHVGFYSQ